MKNKKLKIWITVVSTIVICGILIFRSPHRYSAQGGLYWGSSGSKVTEMQTKLNQWGYYDGAIDGVFGPKTWLAVKDFQSKNGLTVDGIVGQETANALGMSFDGSASASQDNSVNSGDVYMLARAVYAEARGEPYVGQVAVAAVILNRVNNPSFPKSIAGVIYQPGAFTAVSDGQINLAPDTTSLKAARDAMNGWDPTGGAIYYYNPAKTTSSWIWSRQVTIVIGKHYFAI